MTTLHSTRLWRGPDGLHWIETGEDWYDREMDHQVYPLTEAVQDQDTGRWTASLTGHRQRTVAGPPALAGYVEVSTDPFANPQVARLHHALEQVLDDYEQQAGHPHPDIAALRAAFEDVAAMPEKLRRRSAARAAQAASSGFHRGRR
ncbi:hypothetical protein AB0465_37410 [Streptomyces griseoviridis]|uniref:hypothetical protein n=1 Tax=Streptomyces griseoviridis TaxID=45398 RepID=UPI0033E26C38